MYHKCIIVVIVAIAFIGCWWWLSNSVQPVGDESLALVIENSSARDTSTDADIPLADKVGQMFMVGIRGTSTDDEINAFLQEVKPGGIVLFEFDVHSGGTQPRNIESPEQLSSFTTALQTVSPIPLFIAVDAEGGKVNRLKKKYGFLETMPSAQTLGVTSSVASTTLYARALANELTSVGINFNFAPVVDVNVNPESPAIGSLERSFSADPDLVVAHAGAFIDAHHDVNVVTAIKHFPGHGSAIHDTHHGLTDVTSTYNGTTELAPYRALIDSGYTDAIMTAHVVHKQYDTVPATLSPAFLITLLREELGFTGVVISDDMQMGAIEEEYGVHEAVIKSVNAGVDIVLFANQIGDYDLAKIVAVRDAILSAVDEGTIPSARIDEAYDRIVSLKERYGLL